MKKSGCEPFNILVVDDDQYVLQAYEKIFTQHHTPTDEDNELIELQKGIFGREADRRIETSFCLDLCSQGREAVARVKEAKLSGKQYAVAFIDVVMPPGPDGVWTANLIRHIDKDVNIVIVTAYSDKSLEEITDNVQPPDKLFYLKKPFQTEEIKQFACGLSAKWQTEKMLNSIISEQTANLAMTNIALTEEMDSHVTTKQHLTKREEKLNRQSDEIKGLSVALESMFGRRHEGKKQLEETITTNLLELVDPFIEKLRKTYLDPGQEKLVDIIEANLMSIVSPFLRNQPFKYYNFTRNEIHIAKLINQGKSSREICDLLDLSKRTIDFHRDKMREKLGIKNTNISLKNKLFELASEV